MNYVSEHFDKDADGVLSNEERTAVERIGDYDGGSGNAAASFRQRQETQTLLYNTGRS